ncbi:MAG: hypothetical protein IKE53_06815 [Clostridiales bacterium]|nr:hypothetical protein [Clostridiales bacterium]
MECIGYIIVTDDVRFGRMFSGRQILIDGVKNCSFVNVCPSRYICKVLTGDYSDELKALVTSLYRYGSAIVAGNNTKAV